MADFIANSNKYNIIAENELAAVLSHYNSEFVLSVLEDAMSKRFVEFPIIQKPNIVSAWEQNFKMIQTVYSDLPEARTEIMKVRLSTYQEIIEIICKEFDLELALDDTMDMYSAASVLYDFFICNFFSNLVTFFSKYIYNEKNSIYENFKLSELKKNKDSSTLYGKRVYKDMKLAIINANIDYVIANMEAFDISLSTIFDIVKPPYLSMYLNNLVYTNSDFYKNNYIILLQKPELRPSIITEIRFFLQNLNIKTEQQNNYE